MEALLLLQLFEMHDRATWAMKQLRSGTEVDREDEYRFTATRPFNHFFTLFQDGLLSQKYLQMVVSPASARLWVELVAPLDRALRQARHGESEDAPMNPVEAFWRVYAGDSTPPEKVN